MAAAAPKGPEAHWTAQGAVVVAALACGLLLPVVGLALIVPCLVSARRAGASTTAYALALAFNLLAIVLLIVVVFAVHPESGPHAV